MLVEGDFGDVPILDCGISASKKGLTPPNDDMQLRQRQLRLVSWQKQLLLSRMSHHGSCVDTILASVWRNIDQTLRTACALRAHVMAVSDRYSDRSLPDRTVQRREHWFS